MKLKYSLILVIIIVLLLLLLFNIFNKNNNIKNPTKNISKINILLNDYTKLSNKNNYDKIYQEIIKNIESKDDFKNLENDLSILNNDELNYHITNFINLNDITTPKYKLYDSIPKDKKLYYSIISNIFCDAIKSEYDTLGIFSGFIPLVNNYAIFSDFNFKSIPYNIRKISNSNHCNKKVNDFLINDNFKELISYLTHDIKLLLSYYIKVKSYNIPNNKFIDSDNKIYSKYLFDLKVHIEKKIKILNKSLNINNTSNLQVYDKINLIDLENFINLIKYIDKVGDSLYNNAKEQLTKLTNLLDMISFSSNNNIYSINRMIEDLWNILKEYNNDSLYTYKLKNIIHYMIKYFIHELNAINKGGSYINRYNVDSIVKYNDNIKVEFNNIIMQDIIKLINK